MGFPHRQQFVAPDTKPTFGEKLLSHQTDRRGAFTGRLVELEVDAPDLVEVVQPVHDHDSPRSRLRTGWSMLSMKRSRKAIRRSSPNDGSSHSASPRLPVAANTSYAPRDMLA